MTATAAPAATRAHSPSAKLVVLALAHFEGRQMLRHPLLWVGALASVGLAVFELIEEAPVLNRASMTLAWTMAPLAVAAALISGWAVLRARARDDAKPPVATPVGMDRRVAAVAIGLIYPGLATLVVQIGLLAWLMTRDPVTSIVWTELLVGPVYVVFAGTLTAALTRWIPHAMTPLMSVLVLGVVQALVPYHDNWDVFIGRETIAPIYWPQAIIPYEVTFRPAPLHLIYLVGLVLVFAALATMSRRAAPGVVLGVGLLTAVGFGWAQLGPIEESARQATIERLVGEDADITCETRDPISYCAMPGYEGWIDDWASAVAPLLDAAPPDVESIEVRQYPTHSVHFALRASSIGSDDYWWLEPTRADFRSRDVVPTGTMMASWTRQWELVRNVAGVIAGCDSRGFATDCDGEAQELVFLWLIAQDPATEQQMRENAADDERTYLPECMIVEALTKPDTGQVVLANWQSLIDPATTYEEAGDILGLTVPEGYDEERIIAGPCR